MAEHRVVEMLLYILMNDEDPAPKVRTLPCVLYLHGTHVLISRDMIVLRTVTCAVVVY